MKKIINAAGDVMRNISCERRFCQPEKCKTRSVSRFGMKALSCGLAVVMLSVLFIGCGDSDKGSADAAKKQAKPRVIKVTTKFVDNEQTAKSLVKAIKNINERSNGTLELQLFTGGTLPIGKDGMEQVVNGSDWILVDGVNFLGDYVPDYNAVTGPMLYQSFDEYLAMVRTPLVQNLNTKAEELGIKVLSLDWLFGFRSMMTNKVIKTPEDMKGVKLRVPTSQLYTFTIEALGGNPVAMPYPDTYAAIQQGVIDGVEGSIMTYYGTKQYENVKEYSLTRHLLGVSAVCISTKCWDSLTPEQQKIIQEEIDLGGEDNLQATIELESEYAKKLQDLGVRFHEVDAAAFNKAAAPVYSMFDKWTPGIYDDIMVELNKIRADLGKI
jgi:TRAP-type C4-dicarboxylate transport system substrate-binding protein